MRKQKIVNIKDLLKNSGLAEIMQKGTALHRLNIQLKAVLPKEFKELCRVSNIRQNNLVIEVKSAAARQSLMFRQNELLSFIQQTVPEITVLSFKVNPDLK